MLCKKKIEKCFLFAVVCMITLIPVGCGSRASENTDIGGAQVDDEAVPLDEKESADAQTIAEILSDIYAEAAGENTLGSLDTKRRMIARLGERGLCAADMENQIDMTNPEQALAFCRAVEQKESAQMTVFVFDRMGFHKYDLQMLDSAEG